MPSSSPTGGRVRVVVRPVQGDDQGVELIVDDTGTVTVQSQVGSGSTLVVRVPLAAAVSHHDVEPMVALAEPMGALAAPSRH